MHEAPSGDSLLPRNTHTATELPSLRGSDFAPWAGSITTGRAGAGPVALVAIAPRKASGRRRLPPPRAAVANYRRQGLYPTLETHGALLHILVASTPIHKIPLTYKTALSVLHSNNATNARSKLVCPIACLMKGATYPSGTDQVLESTGLSSTAALVLSFRARQGASGLNKPMARLYNPNTAPNTRAWSLARTLTLPPNPSSNPNPIIFRL